MKENMTTEQVIQELRDMATYDCGYEEQSDIAVAAADLLESIQADLTAKDAEIARLTDNAASYQQVKKRLSAEGFDDLDAMIARYKQVMADANDAEIGKDEKIESLTESLAESERRERAAAELIDGLEKHIEAMQDATDYVKRGTGIWYRIGVALREIKDWRGPVAGEGEAE